MMIPHVIPLVMGSGQKILTWVGSGQPSLVWVWKIPPENTKLSVSVERSISGLGQKVPGSKAGRPLIYCGSKVCSGQGPSLE